MLFVDVSNWHTAKEFTWGLPRFCVIQLHSRICVLHIWINLLNGYYNQYVPFCGLRTMPDEYTAGILVVRVWLIFGKG